MELAKKFAGKVVGFDTSPFIYFLEKNRKYSTFLKMLFRNAEIGDFLIVTSTITLLEVLVLPIQENAKDLVQRYSAHSSDFGHRF